MWEDLRATSQTGRQLILLFYLLHTAATGTITVAPDAEGDFALGRVHKTIATTLLDMSQNEESTDQDLVQVRRPRNQKGKHWTESCHKFSPSRNQPTLQELDNQTQELLRALDKLSTEDETGNKVVTSEAIQVRQYLVNNAIRPSPVSTKANRCQPCQLMLVFNLTPLVPTTYSGPQDAVFHAPLSDKPRHG